MSAIHEHADPGIRSVLPPAIQPGYPEWFIAERISKLGPDGFRDSLTAPVLAQRQISQEASNLFLGFSSIRPEVDEFFRFHIARETVENGGMSFIAMAGQPDRLSVNLDITLALLEFDGANPFDSPMGKAARFGEMIATFPDTRVAEFLVRTDANFFMTMVYDWGLRSFDDIRRILKVDESEESKPGHNRVGSVIDIIGSIQHDVLQTLSAGMTCFKGDKLERFVQVLELVKKGRLVMDKRSLWDRENPSISNNNLFSLIMYFGIEQEPEMQAALEGNTREIIASGFPENVLSILLTMSPGNIGELNKLLTEELVTRNIRSTSYIEVLKLFEKLGIEDPRKRKEAFWAIISNVFDRENQELFINLAKLLHEGTVLPSMVDFILRVFPNTDYLEQNMGALIELIEKSVIKKDEDVVLLTTLYEQMGGFITPELSRRYISATSDEERESVVQEYKALMVEVLTGKEIEYTDTGMLAEVIFLAYRPTGFSIDRIKQMINHGQVTDLTEQLRAWNFDAEYPMNFTLTETRQTAAFDAQALKDANEVIVGFDAEGEALPVSLALSEKPDQEKAVKILFNFILESMNDNRVSSYKDNYLGDPDDFSVERVKDLLEMLSVLPDEPEFVAKIEELIRIATPEVVYDAVDRYLWLKRKAGVPRLDREAKAKVEELISVLTKNPEADVSALTEALGEIFAVNLAGMNNEDLLSALRKNRAKLYLGYDLDDRDKVVSKTLGNVLSEWAAKQRAKVKKELKKVEVVGTSQALEITGVVSKNIGSFFAKAGAELCTASNTQMWEEDRHFHLNLAHAGQIVGNVMIYLEKERGYMVARGFNPRRDTMLKFDRGSMAYEIVRVLEQIAKQNGIREIFIPSQEYYHSLSNRDGMAKEVMDMAKRIARKAMEANPDQRTVIEDAEFYVTETGGYKEDKLYLLSVVS